MSHQNEEWCKIWRGFDLSIQNWDEEFDEFWPEHSKLSKIFTLMSCFWPKHIMSELKKVQRIYIALETDAKFERNWLAISKMTWRISQIFVYKLKNKDFVLESKMAELNKNKNLKQPDQPYAVWKLYFTLEMNEWHN